MYSCRTPTGQVAPTVGWSAREHPTYDPTSNTCESGGGLIAAVNAGEAHIGGSESDKATWQFIAPEGETVAGVTMWRAGSTLGGSNGDASYLFLLTGVAVLGDNAIIFDKCAAEEGPDESCPGQGNFADPLAEENRVVAPSDALNSPYLSLSAYCGAFVHEELCPTNEGGKITYDAEVELFAADITLSQPTGPTVSAVSGGLAEDPTVSGTGDVAFHATDPGSGVYEAILEVDGEVSEHEVINEDGRALSQPWRHRRRVACLPLPTALPGRSERRHPVRHDRPRRRRAPPRGERHRCRRQRRDRARPRDRRREPGALQPPCPLRLPRERRGERPGRRPESRSDRGLEGSSQGRPPARPLRPRACHRRDADRPRERERKPAR